jgi:hypothetical protein
MNQTFGAPVDDRTRKRRQYLLKKAQANTLTYMGATLALACCGIWLVGLIGILKNRELLLDAVVRRMEGPLIGLVGLFQFLVLGTATWISVEFWRSSAEEAESIPYTPPIRQQVAPLPADKVLLRGSDAPSASHGLVRAASSNETSPVDLVRPTVANFREGEIL